MSKNEPFSQEIEEAPFQLINKYLLFKYLCVYSQASLGI